MLGVVWFLRGDCQVVSLQEKLSAAEQTREHWMLESKLLQIKYEKQCHVSTIILIDSMLMTASIQLHNTTNVYILVLSELCDIA